MNTRPTFDQEPIICGCARLAASRRVWGNLEVLNHSQVYLLLKSSPKLRVYHTEDSTPIISKQHGTVLHIVSSQLCMCLPVRHAHVSVHRYNFTRGERLLGTNYCGSIDELYNSCPPNAFLKLLARPIWKDPPESV